jgi:hypothetical protein
MKAPLFVIPAKAGTQKKLVRAEAQRRRGVVPVLSASLRLCERKNWVPAFAGMTSGGGVRG